MDGQFPAVLLEIILDLYHSIQLLDVNEVVKVKVYFKKHCRSAALLMYNLNHHQY
jgi:hypothetical protein